jgi:hypothetical protein
MSRPLSQRRRITEWMHYTEDMSLMSLMSLMGSS